MKFRAMIQVGMTALAACAAEPAYAQVRYGIVIGPARDTMEAAWRTDKEQAFCVVSDTIFAVDSLHPTDSLYVIGRVKRAATDYVASDSVGFRCPVGKPSVHTHPGWDTMRVTDCNPSRSDWLALDSTKTRYDVVQCTRTAFVFFFEYMNPLRRRP
jgi:hypothetical protein